MARSRFAGCSRTGKEVQHCIAGVGMHTNDALQDA